MHSKRFFVMMLLGGLVASLAFYWHITNGMFDLSVKEVFQSLLRIGTDPKRDLVIWEFRLPRIVIAALVGIGLGIAGTILQGITRNGLADPGILGINSGAAFTIVIFLFFFDQIKAHIPSGSVLSVMLMPLFGLVGGLFAAVLIFMFAWKHGNLDMQRLILTGIALNTGFGALTMFISLKMNAQDYEMAAVWQAGSIYNANWIYVWTMLPWIIGISAYLLKKAPLLDYLLLEDSSVKSLGIPLEREKIVLLLCSVGLVSACVSVSGSIGFIGLMAPHIARRLVGTANRYVLPMSAMIGICLLMISDFVGKNVFAPSELAVGIVVSILGIPYFLYLLVKTKE